MANAAVLIRAVLRLDGPVIDLTDVPTRQEIEERHVELLVEHGLRHLDLHEITTSRRAVPQTIAADLFDRGAGAVRFPSHNSCEDWTTAMPDLEHYWTSLLPATRSASETRPALFALPNRRRSRQLPSYPTTAWSGVSE